jgi:hypothetical protein
MFTVVGGVVVKTNAVYIVVVCVVTVGVVSSDGITVLSPLFQYLALLILTCLLRIQKANDPNLRPDTDYTKKMKVKLLCAYLNTKP